jgi:hypothetical protein
MQLFPSPSVPNTILQQTTENKFEVATVVKTDMRIQVFWDVMV